MITDPRTSPGTLVVHLGPPSIEGFRRFWDDYQKVCEGSHAPGDGHPWETLEREAFAALMRDSKAATRPFDDIVSSKLKAPVRLGAASLAFGPGQPGWCAQISWCLANVRVGDRPPTEAEAMQMGRVLAAVLGTVLIRDSMHFSILE